MPGIRFYLNKILRESQPEEMGEVYEDLSKGSEPNKDYFIMVSLATIIATLGLLTNNVAVIIGAMLVAPLLTPLIALSFAIVNGDLNLFIKSFEAEGKGLLLVIIIAVFTTLVSPINIITTEIEIRTSPTLFELFIALAAGAAGAIAMARKNISPIFPGVAIATAVLPPLATMGIGMGMKRWDIAIGSFLLFLTNLIAINASCSFIFWILGYGPKISEAEEQRVVNRLKWSGMLIAIVAVPLAYIMITTLSQAELDNAIMATIEQQLVGMDGTSLLEYEFREYGGHLEIKATILSQQELTDADADRIKNALENQIGRKIKLQIQTIKIALSENGY
ncbi:TIGR00341 family protein [Candidatus Micrarchaeota archaeon]|nr:TIGR00341 family protein [Candidatus Micrarchaeota archaeon]